MAGFGLAFGKALEGLGAGITKAGAMAREEAIRKLEMEHRERLQTQDQGFRSSEANKDRGFRSEEAGADRAFRSGEATADRTFRSGEAGKERTFKAGQTTAEHTNRLGEIEATGNQGRETEREKARLDASDPEKKARAGYYDSMAEGTREWRAGSGPDPADTNKSVDGMWELPTKGGSEPVFHPGMKVAPKSGGAGGRASVFEQKVQAYKDAYGKNPDGSDRDPTLINQEALDFANGKKPMSDVALKDMASKMAARRNAGGWAKPADKKKDEDAAFEELKRLRDGGTAAAPAPAAAPAAKPEPSGLLPGGDVKEPAAAAGEKLPRPQTQEEYDALPSGARYIDPDDGKPYRKP